MSTRNTMIVHNRKMNNSWLNDEMKRRGWRGEIWTRKNFPHLDAGSDVTHIRTTSRANFIKRPVCQLPLFPRITFSPISFMTGRWKILSLFFEARTFQNCQAGEHLLPGTDYWPLSVSLGSDFVCKRKHFRYGSHVSSKLNLYIFVQEYRIEEVYPHSQIYKGTIWVHGRKNRLKFWINLRISKRRTYFQYSFCEITKFSQNSPYAKPNYQLPIYSINTILICIEQDTKKLILL